MNVLLRAFDISKKEDMIYMMNKYGTLEKVSELMFVYNAKQKDGKYFEMFAIDVDGIVAGNCYLNYKENYPAGTTLSTGIDINPEYKRKGIGLAAYKQIIPFAFKLGYTQVPMPQVLPFTQKQVLL